MLEALMAEWDLVPDGPPLAASRASVLPVRGARGPAVLKVAAPGPETEHEALALQRWGGRGAVRLLRADPHRRALLLERLTGPDLGDHWDVEACELVGSLHARLHVPAPPQLRSLAAYVEQGTARLAALPRGAPVPHRMVEQAVSLGRELAAEPGTALLHTDLHYAHVLADGAGEWRVVSPKPLAGDPHAEVAPLLWHRWEDVVLSGDVRGTLRRRFHAVVDAALLDEERARDWVVVRTLHRALDALDDRDLVTRCIAVAKAVQE